jgi:hypothetical protein
MLNHQRVDALQIINLIRTSRIGRGMLSTNTVPDPRPCRSHQIITANNLEAKDWTDRGTIVFRMDDGRCFLAHPRHPISNSRSVSWLDHTSSPGSKDCGMSLEDLDVSNPNDIGQVFSPFRYGED